MKKQQSIEWRVYQLSRKHFLVLETIGYETRSYEIKDKGEFKELEAFLKQRREAVLQVRAHQQRRDQD